jgi:arabinofuranosyltransferase
MSRTSLFHVTATFVNQHKKTLYVCLSFMVAAYLLRLLYPFAEVGIDDSNIFFSYAKNLAKGSGIAYGGGLERVEGYTSTLWMLICAFSFFIRTNESGIFIISIGLAVYTAMLCLLIISRYAKATKTSNFAYELIFLMLIFASPSYLIWTTISLMDTALWGALLMSMIYVIHTPPNSRDIKSWVVASVPFALSPLVRPEAFIVTPAFLILLWLRLSNQTFIPRGRILSFLSCTFAASILLLTSFRILYFGYPLPSTYYAKVSPSLTHNLQIGYSYALDFLMSNLVIGVSVLSIIIAFLLKPSARLPRNDIQQLQAISLPRSEPTRSTQHSFAAQHLPLILAMLMLLPVLTGGDHFALSRFYQPAYPIFCLILVLNVMRFGNEGLSSLFIIRNKPVKQILAIVLLGLWVFICAGSPSWVSIVIKAPRPLANEFIIANTGRAKGLRLNDLYATNSALLPRVGVIVAGGIAVTYKGPTVDLMGLNNAYVAHFPGARTGPKNHAAFEKAAFYNLEVDYIDEDPNDWFLVQAYLKNLFYDELFYKNWTYGVVAEKAPSTKRAQGFFSNSYIQKINSSNQLSFTQTLALDTKTWTGRWLKVTP